MATASGVWSPSLYFQLTRGHFLLGYLEGRLALALAGRAGIRVIELARSSSRAGPGAEWSTRRIAAMERVA